MSAWTRLSEFLSTHRHAPTLSVYLEAAPADPTEGRAVALRLRDGIDRLREAVAAQPQADRAQLDACLAELIEAIPSAEHRSRRQGWAFFRTASGAQLVIDTPPGVETSAAWDIGPRVIPFLRAAEPESALLVQVDREHARISLLHDGMVETAIELEADGVGEVQRVATLAEDALPVVVGGAEDAVERFVLALPRQLADRTAVVPTLRMGAADAALPEILEALQDMRRREQAAHIAELRDAAAARGRAALGFERAQRAAELGAIAELIFSDSALKAHPEEVEALVHRALTSGASVEWTALEPAPDAPSDGIVAGLRFAL